PTGDTREATDNDVAVGLQQDRFAGVVAGAEVTQQDDPRRRPAEEWIGVTAAVQARHEDVRGPKIGRGRARHDDFAIKLDGHTIRHVAAEGEAKDSGPARAEAGIELAIRVEASEESVLSAAVADRPSHDNVAGIVKRQAVNRRIRPEIKRRNPGRAEGGIQV